jgi:hypothetical protein
MRRQKKSNTVSRYVQARIEWLQEERAKNNDTETHRILDKSINELYIVLDLIKREAPLL